MIAANDLDIVNNSVLNVDGSDGTLVLTATNNLNIDTSTLNGDGTATGNAATIDLNAENNFISLCFQLDSHSSFFGIMDGIVN